MLTISSSSGVLSCFTSSIRRAVNPGKKGENGEFRCVGTCSANSLSTSLTRESTGLPLDSIFGGASPTSTTSFHFGVGINCTFSCEMTRFFQQESTIPFPLTFVSSSVILRTISGSRVRSCREYSRTTMRPTFGLGIGIPRTVLIPHCKAPPQRSK